MKKMKVFVYKKSFSLLSLLVSMSLISLMMTMLVYGVVITCTLVNRFRCSSHLRQIYYYWVMYLDSYHDRSEKFERLDHMQGQSLKEILENFLSLQRKDPIDLTELFICPSDKFHSHKQLMQRGSYDYRDEMMGAKGSFVFSNISSPQKKILMGDYRSGWHDFSFFPSHFHGRWKNSAKKINVLFADGHVEFISEKKWQENLKSVF